MAKKFPQHVISFKQLRDTKLLEDLFERTDALVAAIRAGRELSHLSKYTLASLFFEPSTRTKLSHEQAMHLLGGKIFGTENADTFSSFAKSAPVEDEIRAIALQGADFIVWRHPKKGSARKAALALDAAFRKRYGVNPHLINGGDGPGEHPTQTLVDLYTLGKRHDLYAPLNLVIFGDLKNGRTVHSLVEATTLYSKIEFFLVAPPELALPPKYLDLIKSTGHVFHEYDDIKKVLRIANGFYGTRIQKERMKGKKNEALYERINSDGRFKLAYPDLKHMRPDASILHPFPRVKGKLTEIDPRIDKDPRAAYFDQMFYGRPVRAALFEMLVAH